MYPTHATLPMPVILMQLQSTRDRMEWFARMKQAYPHMVPAFDGDDR